MKSENTRHKVLLFGKTLFGLSESKIKKHDNTVIDTIPFPESYQELKRLKDYTLIVLDYAAFYSHPTLYSNEQNIFFKLMLEALIYNEDFWLLNETGEKIAIAEVKSYVKGFKKSGIFSLYNHRETNKLDESFPAILFTNNFLQAGSWKNKDRPIDKQDYEVAAHNNILILRIEDLVRLWDGKRKEALTKDDILIKLITSNGWLYVDSDYNISLKK